MCFAIQHEHNTHIVQFFWHKYIVIKDTQHLAGPNLPLDFQGHITVIFKNASTVHMLEDISTVHTIYISWGNIPRHESELWMCLSQIIPLRLSKVSWSWNVPASHWPPVKYMKMQILHYSNTVDLTSMSYSQ